jgi:hypothetical protein
VTRSDDAGNPATSRRPAFSALAPPRFGRGGRSRWPAGRAALAVLVVVLVVLQGCGLPSKTEPKYVGPAPSAASVPSGTAPPGPDDGDPVPSGLITNFLRASVGGNLDLDANTQNTENVERLKKFMTDQMAASWKPSSLLVIRDPESKQSEVDPNTGLYHVTFDIDPIGTLDRNGTFTALVAPKRKRANIAVKPTPDSHYRIADIQVDDSSDAGKSQLLINETAFRELYDWQPIYFWENPGVPTTRLVPDLRYMPRTLSETKRVSAVWDWLKAGPSPLIAAAVQPVPADYETKDTNPQVDASGVKINLTGKANNKPEGLDRLARQVRWSLVNHPPVYLKIADQAASNSIEPGVGSKSDNAALLQASAKATPGEFYVAGGTVRASDIAPTDATATDRPAPPVFAAGGSNTNVISAAVDRSLTRAALVRPTPATNPALKNKQQLWVNSTELPAAKPPKYEETTVIGGKLSRPAWMTYPVQRLLVIADNKLNVSTDDKAKTFNEVSGTSGPAPQMSAFAVAPEGHRIAFISDGKLMVASLTLGQDPGSTLTIGARQQIATTLGSDDGVAWLTETVLVVGGTPAKQLPLGVDKTYSVVAVTVDGADTYPLPLNRSEQSPAEVTGVVADYGSPDDPTTLLRMRTPTTTAMVETNGQWGHVYRSEIKPLQVSPPPSASAEPLKATAAFYPD